MQILLLVLLTGMGLLLSTSHAFAQNCQIQDTFTSSGTYVIDPSHFGACRSGCSRKHTGVDLYFPKNSPDSAPKTQVGIPAGCKIKLYKDGTAIWKSDPTGYGNYMYLDCGTQGGDTITLRYAHILGYDTNTFHIIQGRTGIETASIKDHYHFEVILGNVPVDPECVLGRDKGSKGRFSNKGDKCNKCPIAPGPANLCDASVREALIQHSTLCVDGETKNVPGGSTVDPSRLKGNGIQGDPTVGTGGNEGPDDGSGVIDEGAENNPNDLNDGFTGNPDDIYPPGDEEDPPISPPDPDVPGTPGGAPNLVPKPTPGKEAEKFSGCASDTWTAMVNQAVMETRREDILNKRFIVKPDTVLDYGCFNFHLKKTADEAGPIFSETKHWANLKVDLIGKTVTVKRELGSKSLDGALMDIVQSVATDYRRGQFNNPHLAGSTPVGTSSGGKNCDVMSKVWKAAKCKNFDAVDVFYTFDDLRTKEPREFPANMKCDE